MMSIKTEEGSVWTTPCPDDPKKIVVKSKQKRTLLSMLDGIQLMGTADDHDYDDLAVKRVYTEDSGTHFEMVLDRGTLVLWFEFEVRFFQYPEGIPHV